MTIRRLLIGTALAGIVCAWAWLRPGDEQVQAGPASVVYTVEHADVSGGDRDEAVHRFHTNQARHWRHVMIGSR